MDFVDFGEGLVDSGWYFGVLRDKLLKLESLLFWGKIVVICFLEFKFLVGNFLFVLDMVVNLCLIEDLFFFFFRLFKLVLYLLFFLGSEG